MNLRVLPILLESSLRVNALELADSLSLVAFAAVDLVPLLVAILAFPWGGGGDGIREIDRFIVVAVSPAKDGRWRRQCWICTARAARKKRTRILGGVRAVLSV